MTYTSDQTRESASGTLEASSAALQFSHIQSEPPSVLGRLLYRLSALLAILSGAAILLLMFGTTFDVLARKFAGSGIDGMVEWTEVLLVVVVIMGMMPAEVAGSHIRGLSILPPSSRSARAALLRMLGAGLSAAVLIWAVFATWHAAEGSVAIGEFRMGLVEVPIWPAKIVIPIGIGGFALALLLLAIEEARQAIRLLQSKGAPVSAQTTFGDC